MNTDRDKPEPTNFCYCDIGAGGKPCVNRAYCDKKRGYEWPSIFKKED